MEDQVNYLTLAPLLIFVPLLFWYIIVFFKLAHTILEATRIYGLRLDKQIVYLFKERTHLKLLKLILIFSLIFISYYALHLAYPEIYNLNDGNATETIQ